MAEECFTHSTISRYKNGVYTKRTIDIHQKYAHFIDYLHQKYNKFEGD